MQGQNDASNNGNKPDRKKLLRRFYPILLNGVRTILQPIVFIVFSYLIVHYHSKGLWGGFVDYLLFFYLATLISNWGSKDYLSRSFSEKPKELIPEWQSHFTARLPLLLVTIAIVPFIFEQSAQLYFILWLIAGFVNNAFIPVYTYKRDFGKVILTELLGFALLIFLILRSSQELTVTDLVYFYALSQVLKALVYSLIYAAFFRFSRIQFKWGLLLLSLPFFLMGCAGFLQSKVDLYLFGFFHNKELLGEYQIISGFFIFSQSIATILLLPYLKNIYRMKAMSIRSLKQRMIWVGFFLNSLVVAAIYLALKLFFKIELSALEVGVGFFIGWPSYVYVMHVFYLFKKNAERTVLLISVVSLGFNFMLSLVLLSLDVAILGVLIANAIAQIVAMFLYLSKKIDDDLFKKDK
ncbi:MAG: hypothetical protein GQ574_07395 [Crocinitomix sp.]|nr:hypothetical protein [Crocinitomix sp.]